MIIAILALILAFSVIEASATALDLLNKSVKMFILLTLDNSGSILMFYWLDQRYPILTMASDFMKIKVERRTKSAANYQTMTALLICASSLITVYVEGKTFIDYFFEK